MASLTVLFSSPAATNPKPIPSPLLPLRGTNSLHGDFWETPQWGRTVSQGLKGHPGESPHFSTCWHIKLLWGRAPGTSRLKLEALFRPSERTYFLVPWVVWVTWPFPPFLPTESAQASFPFVSHTQHTSFHTGAQHPMGGRSLLCVGLRLPLTYPSPVFFPIRQMEGPLPPVSITSLAPQSTVVPEALNKVVLLVLFAFKELISCQLMSLCVFVWLLWQLGRWGASGWCHWERRGRDWILKSSMLGIFLCVWEWEGVGMLLFLFFFLTSCF